MTLEPGDVRIFKKNLTICSLVIPAILAATAIILKAGICNLNEPFVVDVFCIDDTL